MVDLLANGTGPATVEHGSLGTTMDSTPGKPSIAILGGGITGLAAAYKLQTARPDLSWTLFEAEPRLGGVLETRNEDGWLIERSADNFITRVPSAINLCRSLGIEQDLIETNPDRRRALVVNRGRVLPVPEGFVLMSPRALWPALTSPILSWTGKLRLACEPLIPGKKHESNLDESLASFASRRLGRETFQRIVQPLVSGIYTADPEQLSMRATLPQFIEQESKHGSLWRAAQRAPATEEDSESGARYSLFVAPKGGMQQLVNSLVAQLRKASCRTSHPIASISRTEAGWELHNEAGQSQGCFQAVVNTLPAHFAAESLRDSFPDLTNELQQIPYAGASVVCLGVREDQIERPINGFGFVVPSIEGRRLIAASFASYKFPNRAPKGMILIRVFVGGALQPELANASDDELVRMVHEELSDLVGLKGNAELVQIARWERRMPQYHLGHLDRVDRIVQLVSKLPGLELAGAAYRGVGIPQCIKQGEQAAERAIQYLVDSQL